MRDTQTFWNNFFFDIFGVKRERVAIYERSADKLKGPNKGRIDLFWPGELLIEQKSLGRDLLGAKQQALGYTHGLSDAELPKRILVCDFRTWELTDLSTNETITFPLEDLPKHIERFNWVLGRQTRAFKDQDPVNIKASELVGHLHDLLFAANYRGHKLEVFLTRMVFCLFADDTGIFQPKDILWDYLEHRTATDGSDLGAKLAQLFDVLNTPEDARQTTLDPDLNQFPYINGGLFAEYFPVPAFDTHMRAALLNACRFDWTPISPAIFGSLFQSVMDAAERRKSGAHYTTEKNILKLIGPLFLDDLHAEFTKLKALKSGRSARLAAFHDKLSQLTFFDPACGCGNFLIIAYRELRALELELLLELRTDGQLSLDAASLSRVDVDQFYGIEISEFPARIAETALWMMDHLMNLALSAAFGGYYPRIPLKKAPHIVHGDALEVDWATVLPPEKCSYVLGNPPFIGKKEQSTFQKGQVRRVFGDINGAGEIDYVACWFKKHVDYSGNSHDIPAAFVSTNSIVQGEQVAPIWGYIVEQKKWSISFAHRTFPWSSEAKGKANVHVVIVGIHRNASNKGCRLFVYPNETSDPTEEQCSKISPYLSAGASIIVRKASEAVSPRPTIQKGSEATDFGFLTLHDEEIVLLQNDPNFDQRWLRKFWGGDEYINELERSCLWLVDVDLSRVRLCKGIVERIRKVKEARLASAKPRTRDWADYAHLFSENRQPKSEYILVPKVSSQRRDYIPMGFVPPEVIVSGSAQFVATSERWVFGLITSKMHMAWMATVGGRTKSDYQYSTTLVYNTFPLPPSTANLTKLDPLAQAVLDARAAHPTATLADLYDPDLMPPNLRAAHTALDRAVDRLYRPAGFASDRERVEHLFALYEQMQAPLLAKAAQKPRKTRAAKPAEPAAKS